MAERVSLHHHHRFQMPKFQLIAHPSTPCPWVDSFVVTIEGETDGVTCSYSLTGDLDPLQVPPLAGEPERSDGLWRHTCFELFVRDPGGGAYSEFNFSPSGRWAVYRFIDYRQGRSDQPIATPLVTVARQQGSFNLTADLKSFVLPNHALIAIAAVLEDRTGKLHYWALRHADGAPDFHHRSGFAARV